MMRATSYGLFLLLAWKAGTLHAQAASEAQGAQAQEPDAAAEQAQMVDGAIAAAVASATARTVVTLPELEHLALQGRASLDADAATANAAEADVRRAKAAYHPQVSLDARVSTAPGQELVLVSSANDQGNYLVAGTRTVEDPGGWEPQVRYGLGLDVRANLYDFGRTGSAVDAARAARNATEAAGEVTRAQIIRLVRGAYLTWLASHELYDVAERAAQDATERRGRVEALIQEGVRPRADLAPAVSDELLAKLELERAQGDVERRKLDLEHAVGRHLPQDAVPDRTLLEMYEVRSRARDPERRALELQREAALASAEAQDSATNPVLAGAASLGTQAQNNSVFPVYSAGINLSVPLWTGGAADAAADAARARASSLSARLREHEQAREHALHEASMQGEQAAERLRLAEALLASCRTQIEEAEARYEAGAAGIEPIAVARTMLRRAQSEVVLAKIARAEAALRAGM